MCLVLALIAAAAGCGHSAASSVTTERSMVTGRIFSAGCPAQQEAQKQCGSWFTGTLQFVRTSECTVSPCPTLAVAAATHSDRAGRFSVRLPAGRYAVVAVGLFNSLSDQSFSVPAGHSVRVHFSIRNGIE